MAKYVTLEYAGAERTLAAWGFTLDGCTAQFWNQRRDVLRVIMPVANATDAEVFAFEAAVILRIQRDSVDGSDNSFSNGSVEFIGKRLAEVVDMRPRTQAFQYQFAGPWYELEQSTYQQPFGSWQSGSLTYPYQSELLLFTRLNTTTGVLSYITNGAQIQDILQFVLDQYSAQALAAPYQIGTIDPALNLLPLPCKPMACADAILKCLELSPDCCVSFDYSTTPPTVNVKSVYNLVAVTLPIADGISHKSMRIRPRPDLQPRAVVIVFKNASTIDGVNFIGYLKQKYGPNGADNVLDPDSGLRVVVDWIDVFGPVVTSIEQSIETAPVQCNDASQANRRTWWGAHDKQFVDLRLRMQNSGGVVTTFPDATVTDADTGDPVDLASYPNELVDGTIHPWMGFNVKRVKITVPLTYAVYDRPGAADDDDLTGYLVNRYTQKEHHIEITVTNGTSGTFSTVSETVSGESIPADLAQNVWTALNRLQYEGDYVKVQAAINGGVSLLNCLNLSGGRAEWMTMKAQIQSIDKDYGQGYTTVNIGPAKHLNVEQLMDIFRAWRFRLLSYNPAVRASGDPGTSSGGTEIAKNAPKKNTMAGLQNPSAQGVIYYDGDSTGGAVKGQSNLDAKIIAEILAATTPTPVTPFIADDLMTLQPREIACCDESGQTVYMVVHSGGVYKKP